MINHFGVIHPTPNADTGVVMPPGRSGHSAVTDGVDMYVYGGFNPQAGPAVLPEAGYHDVQVQDPHFEFHTQVMAEVWKFNFATHTWSLLNTENCPETAASASLLLVGRTLFAYGGTIVPWGKKMSNTIYAADLSSGIWKMMPGSAKRDESDIPLPGYGQSLVYHNNKIYVFTGAVAYVGDPVSHLHVFDLLSGQWERLKPSGKIPEGRYKQEMVFYKDRLILIGGGFERQCASLDHIFIYWLNSNCWERITTLAEEKQLFPSPRACFASTLQDHFLYIMGGRVYSDNFPESILQDTWKLDLVSYQWQRLRHLNLPVCISFPTACLSPNGYVYVYGGILYTRERNKNIFRAKLFIPKLVEMCFELVMTTLRQKNCKLRDYQNMGIPHNFLSRIQPA